MVTSSTESTSHAGATKLLHREQILRVMEDAGPLGPIVFAPAFLADVRDFLSFEACRSKTLKP